MVRIKLLFGMLFFTGVALAQGGGLTFSQAAGSYTSISGGTVLASGVFDDVNYAVTLPAAFTFRGTSYTQVVVNTNGWIALGGTAPANNLYVPISTSTAVPGFISPFGMDLENADGGVPEIRWEQLGNEIVFQWKDVKRWTSSTNSEIFSFQLRLNTVTFSMQFVYGSFLNVTTSTSSPQVGIRTTSNAFPANIYNRLVNTVSPTNSWATSAAGTANNNTCRLSSTAPATVPASGQTYTWTPVDCSAITCTTNLAPANGSTINTASVNLSWGAASGAASYKLYFGNSLPLPLQGTYSGTTATIGSLVINNTYSWYVVPVGFNCEVSGCESTTTSFNTVCAVSACTSNTSPADNTTINNTSVTLNWNAAAGATSYNVYMGTSFPLPLLGNSAGTSRVVNNLLTNTTYSWYVQPVADNCSVSGCESNVTTFHTGCLPLSCVAGISPANGSTTGGNVSFNWNSAPTASNYDLYLGNNNPPSFYGTYTTTSTSALVLPGTYFWYVVPRSGCSTPTGCEANVRSFTYSTLVPNDICLTATDLSSVVGSSVSTIGGNTEGVSLPGACATGSRDIWYKFRAIASTASVSVSGGGSPCYDPGIQALSGTCAALTCLGNDDSGSCTSVNTVSMTGLTIGSIYYIRIYSTSSGGGQFAVNGTNIGSTLPLRFLSFTGSRKADEVRLQWKTQEEQNTFRFIVESSSDGIQFGTIGEVMANNGPGEHRYSHTSRGIPASTTLFRLKQEDLDGRFTYSAVLKLSTGDQRGLTLFPNPAGDRVTVGGLEERGVIRLLGMDGRRILQVPVTAQSVTLDLAGVARGVYLLQYHSGGAVVNQKLVRQ